jgi:hypothetical protein
MVVAMSMPHNDSIPAAMMAAAVITDADADSADPDNDSCSVRSRHRHRQSHAESCERGK